MTVYAILGGIGSGKTMAMVYMALQDAQIRGKKILSNIKMVIPHFQFIKASMMETMPKNLKNITLCIDEIHNFMDSRSGTTGVNKKRTHFILQSRHAGQGSLDIIYTTQFLHQVDKRLRNNTDVKVYPYIIKRDEDSGLPIFMMLSYMFQEGMKLRVLNEYIVTEPIGKMYDTHEIVELDA